MAPVQSGRSLIPHNLFTEQWRDLLVPAEPLQVSRPRGLRQRTYERLVDEYNRLLAAIADLPTRSLWPHIQKAYEHQFLNRIVRVRRRLGLPAPGPPDRRWYRTGEAALFLVWVDQVRPPLDSERLLAMRACRFWGAPLLRDRGADPREE